MSITQVLFLCLGTCTAIRVRMNAKTSKPEDYQKHELQDPKFAPTWKGGVSVYNEPIDFEGAERDDIRGVTVPKYTLDDDSSTYDHEAFVKALEGKTDTFVDAMSSSRAESICLANTTLTGKYDYRKNVLAPSVFLIGVQKGATTTLSMALWKSPDILFPGKKEFHNFDSETNFQNHGGRSGYLNQFQDCSKNNLQQSGKTTMDATPNYLQAPMAFAPKQIYEMYGNQRDKLHFIVTLRHPFYRMQSHFHHVKSMCKSKSDHVWHATHPSMCATDSFKDYVDAVIEPSNKAGRTEEPVRNGQYGVQIVTWFRYFQPSQFTFIPIGLLDDEGSKKKIVEDLWAQIGVRKGGHDNIRSNVHKHTALAGEGLSHQQLTQMKKIFRANASPKLLGEILAGHDPKLVGCDGCEGNSEKIAQWLHANWRAKEDLLPEDEALARQVDFGKD